MQSQLAEILSIKNTFAIEQIQEGFTLWPKTLDTCVYRASLFSSLQRRIASSTADSTIKKLDELHECVKELDPLLRESTAVEKEGYDQIRFTGTPWSGLNSVPFALLILSVYKSYIVPGLGLLLPFISWILPYFVLTAFYNIPITFAEYSSILWRMWNGQAMPRTPEEIFNPPPVVEVDALTKLKRLVQNSWTIFTLGQALWQPIQQARHFMRLDADCIKLGTLVVGVKGLAVELSDQWSRWLPSWFEGWLPLCPSDPREAFAFVLETPYWLRHTLRCLGRFEVLLRLGSSEGTVPAEFVSGDAPVLMIKDFGDPSIPVGRRVKSSIGLGGLASSHSILTGPNRGGKSSFLRGVITNVVVAHSFGCVFAEKAQMTPFTWIADGMRLDDTPGEQSMFEREVAFGSAILQKSGGRGLVLYDELFHSTNPPDAKRTSEIFCDSLWKKRNCVSIVSTHVYSLARESPSSVKKICVAAWKKNAKYKFSYKIQQGICEVSSVDLLLKQFKFSQAAATS